MDIRRAPEIESGERMIRVLARREDQEQTSRKSRRADPGRIPLGIQGDCCPRFRIATFTTVQTFGDGTRPKILPFDRESQITAVAQTNVRPAGSLRLSGQASTYAEFVHDYVVAALDRQGAHWCRTTWSWASYQP